MTAIPVPGPQSPAVAVCCRDCGRLRYLRRQNVPSRQFWTANMVAADDADENCHGPVTEPKGARVPRAQRGLAYPHYCTMYKPV